MEHINSKTTKEQKDGEIARIIQLRSELNKKALTDRFLNKINCASRMLMLEDLEAEMQFKADFKK